jgi:hypothetical protein
MPVMLMKEGFHYTAALHGFIPDMRPFLPPDLHRE